MHSPGTQISRQIRISNTCRNPAAGALYFLSAGTGDTLVGGLAGATMSWHVDMNEVFVCRNGKSVKTSFPEGLIAQIGQGAELGRCEFLD